MEWNKVKIEAEMWIKESGDILRSSLNNPLDVQAKSNPNDLVTQMDHEIEQFLTDKIKNHYPAHLVLGEEGRGDELTSTEGIIWIIDPIDGTTNFVHQKYNFSISLGIFENGQERVGIIYNVMDDECFTAVNGEGAYLNDSPLQSLTKGNINESIVGLNARWLLKETSVEDGSLHRLVKDVRGIRSYGSAAIELAYVAAGRLDAYVSFRLSPWDYAGGAVILKEVGALLTSFDGEELPLLGTSSLIAARPGIHEDLISYVSAQ
ncbi:inositol monophosphatase family protein [Thalassorhabdus alkalitolerans]|uniref:inositol-phosphate phosphatase n=1 Tax=Thalassorhabdus alkalitolerans TaxID=2282697 RepID=A0ABW0YLI4_9BACI